MSANGPPEDLPPPARSRRPQPTRALLLLAALVAGAALLQYAFRGGSGGEDRLRFVVQAERRALPPLRFSDGDGNPADLARGRVVLLNIWATWCAPCRQEMPALDRVQALLAAEGLHVVALSIDKGAAAVPAVKAFYASLGIRHLGVYNDPEGEAGYELGVPGVPVTFLLDRDGREIGRLVGPAEWDGAEAVALIRRHLAVPRPPSAAASKGG